MRAILTYHSIDPSGSVISVSPRAFRQHIRHLLSMNVRFVTVDDIVREAVEEAGSAAAGREPGRNGDAVALTFDDGFANVATEAAPLLAEHGIPATVFVVTDFVGAENRWAVHGTFHVPTLPLLDWPALERLVAQGVAIGSHSVTHRDLTTLGASDLAGEIEGAEAAIVRRLGQRPRGFAYPYGFANAAVRAAVEQRHTWACTAGFACVDGNVAFDLPRLEMRYFERPGLFEQWGSAAFARWVRRRRRLRAVRSWLRRIGVP